MFIFRFVQKKTVWAKRRALSAKLYRTHTKQWLHVSAFSTVFRCSVHNVDIKMCLLLHRLSKMCKTNH